MSTEEKNEQVPPARNYPVPEEKMEEVISDGVQIHDNVISLIAQEAAKRVPGVVELSGTLVDGIADMIGKRSRERGVRVANPADNTSIIDLTVVLEFGINIPDTCVVIQNEVRKAVEGMTGKKVQAVNVSVQGIRRSAPNTAETE